MAGAAQLCTGALFRTLGRAPGGQCAGECESRASNRTAVWPSSAPVVCGTPPAGLLAFAGDLTLKDCSCKPTRRDRPLEASLCDVVAENARDKLAKQRFRHDGRAASFTVRAAPPTWWRPSFGAAPPTRLCLFDPGARGSRVVQVGTRGSNQWSSAGGSALAEARRAAADAAAAEHSRRVRTLPSCAGAGSIRVPDVWSVDGG